jgi:4'-phosphopantetheinyl transferase
LTAISVDFWTAQLDTENSQYEQYWRVLDNNEKMRAEKFSNALAHQRYVAAHGQLRLILAHYIAQPAAHIQIQKTSLGKPYLIQYPETVFNLSHTDNYLAVAVANACQLGVDIELCKQRSSMTALVKKCFSSEEADYWRQLPEQQQVRAFYQFWTRKEAFVKATGLGIALGLKECAINPAHPQQFLAVPARCGLASDWHSRDIELGQNLCAALVADKAIAAVNIRQLADH